MTCDERNDPILMFAAGLLEAPERDELARHLDSGCPRCAGALAEARAVLAHVPLALTPIEPSPAVKARLLARVAAPRPPRRLERYLSPLVAAGLAAAAVYVLVVVPLARERRMETETARLLESRAAVVATLAGTETQPQAWGRILWDREQRTVRFYTGNLAPLPPGRTYELWLINDAQEKIPAGTFDVDPSRRGQLVVRLGRDVGNVVLAAVTDEPSGGAPQPTGSIQLAGELSPSL